MIIYILFGAIIFLIVACVLVLVSVFSGGGKRSRLDGRLAEIKGSKLLQKAVPVSGTPSNFLSDFFINFGKLFASQKLLYSSADSRLHAAGFYSEDARFLFMGIRSLLPGVLLLITVLLALMLRYSPVIWILAAIGSLSLGFYLPVLILRILTRKRKLEILRAAPDALDLIAVCIEAGSGFDTAIKRVAEEMALSHVHISKEFMSYFYETQMGVPRHEALRNLARRTDIDIIRNFVVLLIQSDKLGTSIVSTLRVYSDSMRTKRRQDAEVKAARLPVLMIFPLMFFILPSLFLVILGPAVISVFKNLIAK